MNRRESIKLGLASIWGINMFPYIDGSSFDRLAVSNDQPYDLIIAGGGPAAMGAALMAAALDMKTLIIEKEGCLGGVWTSGLLCNIMDQTNKKGANKRIIKELNRVGGNISSQAWSYVYHPEDMKYVLEQLCERYNIDIRLHSRVIKAEIDDRKIASILVASHTGLEKFKSDMFIDATGNGDLGAVCGAGFEMGHPKTGDTQPMSLMALLTGIDKDKAHKYVNNPGINGKHKFSRLLSKHHIHPSYSLPTLWRINEDLYGLMANHAYGFSGTDARDVTKATLEARKEIFEMVQKFKAIDGFEKVQLVSTAEQIGIREGRRISGKYTVKKEDLIQGIRHPDAVCRVTLGIDVHSLDPDKSKSYDPANKIKTKPYDIPARALISRDIKNLLMAGRCISGDFYAHSSYRVTGNSVALGEGAAFTADLLRRNQYRFTADHYKEYKQLEDKRIAIEG